MTRVTDSNGYKDCLVARALSTEEPISNIEATSSQALTSSAEVTPIVRESRRINKEGFAAMNSLLDS